MAKRLQKRPPARDVRAAQLIADAIRQLMPRGVTLNPEAQEVVARWNRMIEHQRRMQRVARDFFRRSLSGASRSQNHTFLSDRDRNE